MLGADDFIYKSKNTLTDKLRIDREIEEMKKHPIDYSDIPERKNGAKVRFARKEFPDTLPRAPCFYFSTGVCVCLPSNAFSVGSVLPDG